jgi:signal recognition particle subunit SRP19
LKDYDHIIVWTDYINRNLSRRKGRKIAKERAVYDPSIQELVEASKLAGFEVTAEKTNENARFPRRPYVRSGYIMLEKNLSSKKIGVIQTLAERITQKRARVSKRG